MTSMHPGLLWAAAGLLVAGCGTPVEMGQVEGTVRAGGQPLSGVLVTFIPTHEVPGGVIRSMGKTDGQGRYRLQAENQQDGAVVGQHQVIVEDLAIYSAPRDADGTVTQLPPERVPQAYSDLLQTKLQREVQPGEQTIDLDLTASP